MKRTLSLASALFPDLMPVACAFAETSARSFGLDDTQAYFLSLATEELFMNLCDSMLGHPVELFAHNAIYSTSIEFRFSGGNPDLKAFNCTTNITSVEEDELDKLGLLIASRSCDSFQVRRESGGVWSIILTRDKRYPDVPFLQQADQKNTANQYAARITVPNNENLKELASIIASHYASRQLHENFTHPGRLADMVASGKYSAATAVNQEGLVTGGIIWHNCGSRIVECFGPCHISGVMDVSQTTALLDHCLERLARTGVRGVSVNADLPDGHLSGFEFLGTFLSPADSLKHKETQLHYRQLEEDFGALAFIHKSLHEFAASAYDRLHLPREIRLVQDTGEHGDDFTLFAPTIFRKAGIAVLRALLVGRDARNSIEDHLKHFSREGIAITTFVLDTASSSDALLVPHLLACGFKPRLIIPWGGDGDAIYLQRSGR